MHSIWPQLYTSDFFPHREISLCVRESLKIIVPFSGKQHTGSAWKGREVLVMLCEIEIVVC